jgi:hypothetical protein
MDRRAVFFFGAALACFVLAPVGLPKYSHIAVTVGCVYVVLSVLSFFDSRGRRRSRGRRTDR